MGQEAVDRWFLLCGDGRPEMKDRRIGSVSGHTEELVNRVLVNAADLDEGIHGEAVGERDQRRSGL